MTMNQIYNADETYRTADLALTTALCVSGFTIEDIERASAHRSVFIFEKTIKLLEVEKRYWNGELRIEPQAYFNQLKIIKTRIYDR